MGITARAPFRALEASHNGVLGFLFWESSLFLTDKESEPMDTVVAVDLPVKAQEVVTTPTWRRPCVFVSHGATPPRGSIPETGPKSEASDSVTGPYFDLSDDVVLT